MIKPADRVNSVQEYYFSVKLKQIEQMRSEGKDVINLGIGSPDRMPAPEVIETLGRVSAKEDVHGYQSYLGIPALRQAFALWYQRSYGVELDPASEILTLMGSKEGIMHISMAFLNPGDEVLIPNPGYPTYKAVTNLVGAKARTYTLNESNGWQPDLSAIEKEDLSRVKLMWINYPHMPTGAAADMDVMKQIIAFGKKHNIVICNDNPYSFVLNPEPSSLLSVEGAKDIAIELNSLSKSHNMAGWRIGMAASNSKFINYILRVKSNMDSGMYRPLQEAAVKALEAGADWYKELNAEYAERRKLVFEIMDALRCSYNKKQVGLFVWGRIPSEYPDGQELSDLLLEKANVFITPGFIFGDSGEQYIRVSLCSTKKILAESLNRVNRIVNKTISN
ncbi:MAG TPA: aminotransferase class I/II-fold pyridoxal phosphate-dependent enzyme [Paludibacter sp.]|nr:aminotransferase class I/II-fold pyridoxal phosphate-dependent enzyme [Paludibacter sp.]HOS46405.1 aminotransferase class I/II-fold pyridoxal phosphate-dependent enzyme [Paludibacter sp.]HPM10428.1 aminotransferase class I/II-fold pyridoxal phosphate-dependent enzyme [Paludibacter sp.]